MWIFRWLEPAIALAGAVFGFFQLHHILFDSMYSYSSSTGEHGKASLAQLPDAPVDAFLSLGLEGLVLLITILCAAMHARTRQVIWRHVLWGAATFLILWSLLGIGTIGFMLIPAALLVVLSAVCALGIGRASESS